MNKIVLKNIVIAFDNIIQGTMRAGFETTGQNAEKAVQEIKNYIENEPYSDIGSNIKSYRISKAMSQEQLAEKLNVARTSISNMELNRHNITTENLKTLCKTFNCSSYDLLGF
jgi:DNA-binding XRE family transcriptional regulator